MRALGITIVGLCMIACGAASTASAPPASGQASRAAPAPEPARLLSEEEAARTHAEAMQVHVRAQELRNRCGQQSEEQGDAPAGEQGAAPVTAVDNSACEQSQQFFGLAADTWRALVEGRPDDVVPEWLFMLAQALFHSQRFEPAAESAERYLASGAPEWRLRAAFLLVAARERALAAAGVALRDAPPEPAGDPPAVRAIDLPPALASLIDARARFAEVVAQSGDEQGRGRRALLANAMTIYHYGHWDRAREGLEAVLDAGCTGEGAWEGAADAWRALRDIGLALGRYDAVQALGARALACDFGLGAPSCAASASDPRCLARADRVALQLRGATQFMLRARHARPQERPQLAARAAEAYLAALDGDLDPRGRATALVEASEAFRLAGANDRAAEVDARIVREIDTRRLDEADRPYALVSIAEALSRQLDVAIAASAHEEIVTLASRLAARDLELPELVEPRARARTALAEALAALGRHAETARAYSDLAAADSDPVRRREAELRSALALAQGRGCGAASRPLRAFVAAHRGREGAGDAVVRALWRLAECQRRGSPAHTAALEELVQATEAAGELGFEARGHAASARFLLADAGFASATNVRIRLAAGENVEDMVTQLRDQLAGPSERVNELLAGYANVERLGDARASVAARQRSGEALEALDRAVREASWELPRDLTRQRGTLNRADYGQIQRSIELRAAEILRTQAVVFRCRAAAHYQRAIQLAGPAGLESPELAIARERLGALELPQRCPR
ncbi:MAG: hypothetical protein IT378_11495 [Sandaracinaceae bacterium]|nr:hypothetical protein [Sandaracinaceae bacterium]